MANTYKSAFSGAQMEDTFDMVQNKKITAADVGAVPAIRKVNNKELSADIDLTASDVGAVPMLNGGKSIFVNSEGGSDTTGDGTSANAYQTFDRAWQDVPMFLNGMNCTLYLDGSFTFASNQYRCPVGGYFTIARPGSVNPTFTIAQNQNVTFVGAQYMAFNGVNFTSSVDRSGVITISDGLCTFNSCVFTGLSYALYFNNMGSGRLYTCTFNNNTVAIASEYASIVGVYAASGSNNGTGYLAARGGVIGMSHNNLSATTMYVHANGGVIKNGSVDISNGISVSTTAPTSALANDAQVQVYDA